MNPNEGALNERVMELFAPGVNLQFALLSKSCGLMPLFPLIAGPDILRESRSLSGNPHEGWCGEGE